MPTLSSWAQSCIRALAQAKGREEFDTAFDAFVSMNVKTIMYNGRPVSREEYKRELAMNEMHLNKVGKVKFDGVLDRPAAGESKGKNNLAGVVGVFYDTNFDVRDEGHPDEFVSRSSMNMEIHDDTSVLEPQQLNPARDRRRVFMMDHIDTELLNPGGTCYERITP